MRYGTTMMRSARNVSTTHSTANSAERIMMKSLMGFMAVLLGCMLALPAAAQQVPYGQWGEIPGTAFGPAERTSAEIGSAWCGEVKCPGGHFAWTGMAYDYINHLLSSIRSEGHTDGNGADSYTVPIMSAIAALPSGATWWYRSEPVQHLTGQRDSNGNCPWPGQGGPANHTYDNTLFIGAGKYFTGGSPYGCNATLATPGNFAFFVDSNTNPWTWTRVPALDLYVGDSGTAIRGQHVYIVNQNGKLAKFDKDTGAIVESATAMTCVKKNGVLQICSSSLGNGMAAVDITTDGYLVVGNENYINVSNTSGTLSADGLNDDRWFKFIRRGVRTNAPAGSCLAQITAGEYAITAIPDGNVLLWQGAKKIIKFKPGAGNNPAADECTVFDPATGPTPQNAHIFGKLFWDDTLHLAIGYSNRVANVQLFNPIAPSPNLPPVANDTTVVFAEDTTATGNATATDPESGPLTYALVGSLAGLTFNPDGSFVYIPAANDNGPRSFDFTVIDDHAQSDTGAVTLNILPVNDPPIAQNDAYTFDEDTQLSGNVLTNDSDPVEGSPLTAAATIIPPDGSLTLNPDGSFTYQPCPDCNGTRTFGYTVSDGTDTAQAVVTLTITDVPDDLHTSDFVARCALVDFCQGFNDPLPTGSSHPESVFLNQGVGVMPVEENGALKLVTPEFATAGSSGQYQVQFSRFGRPSVIGGGEVWASWRQWMPSEFIYTRWLNDTGGLTTFKMATISAAGSSLNTGSEQVFVGDNFEETPVGQPVPKELAGYYEGGSYKNWTVSNGSGSNVNDDFQPLDIYTLIPQTGLSQTASTARRCWANHRANCVLLIPSHWMTFLIHEVQETDIITSDGGSFRRVVHLELWQKNDGEAPQKVVDQRRAQRFTDTIGFGSFWLTSYMTRLDSTINFGATYTLYDEVMLKVCAAGEACPQIPWTAD